MDVLKGESFEYAVCRIARISQETENGKRTYTVQACKQVFIDHFAAACLENGSCIPDAMRLRRIAKCLRKQKETVFL